MQDLADFAPFIAVLERFFGLIIRFAENKLGITNCLRNNFQRFSHELTFLFLPYARKDSARLFGLRLPRITTNTGHCA